MAINLNETQPAAATETGAGPRPAWFQWLKAAFACFAIYVALAILLAMILVASGVREWLLPIVDAYMFFGWVPLAIWLCPFLRRKMK